MVGLGQPVLDAFASQIMSKRIGREEMVFRFKGCSANWLPFALGLGPVGLNRSVGENGVNQVGQGFEPVVKAFPGCLPVCPVAALGHGELARRVDADEQSLFFSSGLHPSDSSGLHRDAARAPVKTAPRIVPA